MRPGGRFAPPTSSPLGDVAERLADLQATVSDLVTRVARGALPARFVWTVEESRGQDGPAIMVTDRRTNKTAVIVRPEDWSGTP